MKDQAALALGHGLPARPLHAGAAHMWRDFHSVHDREIRYASGENAHLARAQG